MSERAAIFDMDRTLVTVNTGDLYVRWRYRRQEASLRDVARFARWMVRYKVGLLDAPSLSRRALSPLRGLDEAKFRQELAGWYAAEVRRHISSSARREVEARRREGRVLAVLSASTNYAAEALAADLGIEHVLCTRLEVQGGRFTGRATQLCYGAAKVPIAETWARQHGVDLDRSAFYTDSVSDLEMLERVGEARVVNPDPRLRLKAALRGWPVERWR